MESSTKLSSEEQQALARWAEPEWDRLTGQLQGDVERIAREEKALVRKRKVKGALNLLRVVLAYAVSDWSLRLVGAWAVIQGIANRTCPMWDGYTVLANAVRGWAC